MKKSYFLLAAGLAMGMTATAAVKSPSTAMKAPVAQEMQKLGASVQKSGERMMKVAPKKAVSSIDDLLGAYNGFYEVVLDGTSGKLAPYFSKGENEGEIIITQMPYTDVPIVATLNDAKDRLIIKRQHTLYFEKDGIWLDFIPVKVSITEDDKISLDSFLDQTEGIITDEGVISFPEDVMFSLAAEDTTIDDFRVMWAGLWVELNHLDYFKFISSEWSKNETDAQFTDGWFNTQFQEEYRVPAQPVEVLVNNVDHNLIALRNPYKSEAWEVLEDAQGATGLERDGFIVFTIENPKCVPVRPVTPCGYYLDTAGQDDPEPIPEMCYPFNKEGVEYFTDGSTLDEIVAKYTSAGAPLSTFDEATRTVNITNAVFGFGTVPSEEIYWIDRDQQRIEMDSKIVLPEFSGVEGIEVENADAAVKYYNMQGMEIANPAEGQLVIKKQGNKAVKVIM